MVGDVGGSNPRQMSSILTDHDRKAAALPIEVFGEPMVCRMESGGGGVEQIRKYQDRVGKAGHK